MHSDIESVLLSAEQIDSKVSEIAEAINRDYAGMEPIVISVLKGSFIFMADLVRKFNFKCTVDFMSVSSYGDGTSTSGRARISKDLDMDIAGKDVIIVEDILDSGVTLSYLMEVLGARKPASISICTLLDKPSRRKAQVWAKYSCFEVPDAFVVGYGLDYAQKYRNLPYIGILKPEVYGG